MNRLFAAPNSNYWAAIVVAVLVRMVLGGLPLVGGLIGFVAFAVIAFNLVKIFFNVAIRPADQV